MQSKVHVAVRLLLAIVGTVLLVGPATTRILGEEKVRLCLSLKAGQTYKQKMTTDLDIKQTVMGMKMDMTQAVTLVYRFEILNVDREGRADCKITYDTIAMKQDGPAGKSDFDTSKPDSKPPKEMQTLAALAGQSFTLTLSPSGRVTNVKGCDALMERILKATDIPAANRATLEKQLKTKYGDQALGETMEGMLAIYPDQPIGIGESWQRRISVSTGIPMVLDNTWTLKGISDGVAIVDVVTKISANNQAEPVKAGQMGTRYAIKGSQKGVIKVPLSSGWITASKVTQNLSGNVEVTGMPGSDKPISWPIEAASTITLELMDK